MRLKMANQITVFEYVGTETGADLIKTVSSENNGWVKQMIVVVPDFLDAPNAVITINDTANGVVPFTSVACPSNATTKIGDTITAAELGSIPLGEHPWTLTCTLSATPGSAGKVKVISYFSM